MTRPRRNFGGDFYNYGAGLVLSYPLGNRSAYSTYNKRQLEARNAQASLQSVRQQIIVGVREAVRRVHTDFKRIETTRSARIMAEKQLQAEQERLKVGAQHHPVRARLSTRLGYRSRQ